MRVSTGPCIQSISFLGGKSNPIFVGKELLYLEP